MNQFNKSAMMKTIKFVTGLWMVFAAVPAPVLAHSLTEAIEKALHSNPEIFAAKAALNVSKEQLNSAQAAYLPTVDLSLTAGEENTAKPASAVTDMWQQDHSLTLTQKLFDGGSTKSAVERSEEMNKQAMIRLEDLKGTITLNVIESWYELYRLQRVGQMTQKNVAQHSQLFAQIQQKVKVGAAGKAELTAAEGPYIGALTAQASNRGQLSDAIARYTKVVGERPEGMLPNPDPLLSEAELPETVEAAVTQMIATASAIRTAESNLLAAGADHRGAKAGMLPTMDFEFKELMKNDAAGTDGTEYGWSALVKVNYNLFRGGADEARRRETAQALVESREQLMLAQRTAEEQIRTRWSALQVSRQILGLNQRQLRTAGETLRSTREQFKLGEVEMMAVMGAEDGLFQAQQSVLQERVTGTLARYRLLNQLGLLKMAAEAEQSPASEADDPRATEIGSTDVSDELAAAEHIVDRVLGKGRGVAEQIALLLNQPSKPIEQAEPIMFAHQPFITEQVSATQELPSSVSVFAAEEQQVIAASEVDFADHRDLEQLLQQGEVLLDGIGELFDLKQLIPETSFESISPVGTLGSL